MNNYVEISRKHIKKLQQMIKSCNIRHGPFQRSENIYKIPIKDTGTILLLLLSLSETDIKVIDNI